MIKLKTKVLEETPDHSKYLYNLSGDKDNNWSKVHKLDVETMVEEIKGVAFPRHFELHHHIILRLPKDELLIFNDQDDSVAYILNCLTSKTRKIWNLYNNRYDFPDYEQVIGAVYWDNSIYMFYNDYGLKNCPILSRYDLSTGKNIFLANFPIPVDDMFCHNVCFEEKLILAFACTSLFIWFLLK
ncbi:unnamed protein product [Blepharisma stoltei]|uniref:Uncharacterized protein n=1 Tax=Blepharisma stoltei TaxID=1481888 RepID=A0AAU9K5U6_9CILI|nr:unnamed protein product [Blepharisma stoltei]